jgi:precorrin-6Y C5,15-methyltransferase (decarboxylating)
MTAWLHIVGIGEDGMDGLSPAARTVVEAAEVIIGGDRHHHLSDRVTAERIAWPSPFDAMIAAIAGLRGRRAVILVTGDPLWYSVGARILRGIPPEEITFHPALSAFQWAAARMGWSLADVETITVHGRPVEQMIPFIQPRARLLILTTGAETPAQIAAILRDRGYAPSRLTVLANLGGPAEQRIDGTAEGWQADAPPFNTMAVECLPGPQARVATFALPDDAFRSDGTMTKSEIRALTLARLMPMRGALLWDVGAGCGSVGIEWMRMARDARAIAIEPREDRRLLSATNATALGAPALRIIAGEAPAALHDLPAPDAVFLGGGLSADSAAIALDRLTPFGRLVANAVTVESEAILSDLHRRHGGDLTRIDIARLTPIGPRHGWKPAMPVVQWSLVKR